MNEPVGRAWTWLPADVLGGCKMAPGAGGVNEPAGGLDGDADGLFDLHVETGLQAGDTEPVMQKVRGANVRRVTIGRRQQVCYVAKDGWRSLLPRRCRRGNFLSRRKVRVTDGDKLEQLRLNRADRCIALQVRPRDPAAADQCQPHGHVLLPSLPACTVPCPTQRWCKLARQK